MKRLAYWLAARTGVGQDLYDEGWQKGYRDRDADIAEDEAVAGSVFDMSGQNPGLFPDSWYEDLDEMWSD